MRNPGRSAYTLIEVIIAMTMVVGLMSVLGALVSQVITANAASREHVDDIATLGSLGRQFRGDVRAAAKVTISAQDAVGRTLSLTAADGATVEYKIEGSTLQRALSNPTPTRSPRREVYTLNTMHFVGWKQDGNEVALTVARGARSPTDAQPNATFDIVAVMSGASGPTISP